jgi:hypothetical protein
MEKTWMIKEKSFNSIKELNQFIEKEGIQPSDLIEYRTMFEQLRQNVRYLITFWSEVKKGEN